MRRIFFIVSIFAFAGYALAAQTPSPNAVTGPVYPYGTAITPGHCAEWQSYGYLEDSGSTCGGGSSITLTTTGTSGASTLVGSNLNIPIYSSGSGSFAVQATTSNAAIYPLMVTGTGSSVSTGYIDLASPFSYNSSTGTSSFLALVTTSIVDNGNASLAGTTTFSGAINATGLSSGTVAANSFIGLNSSKQLVLSAASGGVSSFSGDGTLLNNSLSTGAVTATLANAAANTLWGNNTSGATAPSYQTSFSISSSGTATIFNATTAGTAYEIGGNKILFLPDGDTSSVAAGQGSFAAYGNTSAGNNTGVGGGAFAALTTGTNNVAIGFDALNAAVTDGYSTAVGANALKLQAIGTTTTATGNVAVGYAALTAATSQPSDVAVGNRALVGATSGTGFNVAVGPGAGSAITTGSENVIVGNYVGGTTNNMEVAVGYNAQSAGTGTTAIGAGANAENAGTSVGQNAGANSSGSNNAFFGSAVGEYDSTGGNNTGVGYQALLGNSADRISGSNNTAVGYNTLSVLSGTSTGNTGVGSQALLATATNAGYNTAVGYLAGALNTTGTGNIEIGYNTDNSVGTIGSDNILIGNSLALSTSATSNTINIGGIWTVTGAGTPSTAANTINGTITVPNVASSSSAQTGTLCWNTGGLITYDPTLGCLSSDRNLKTNIAPLHGALDEVLHLKPSTFQWKNKPQDQEQQIGFIAQDVSMVDKRLVAYDERGNLRGVRYEQDLPTLAIAAIQEQQTEIEAISVLQADPCAHLSWLGREIFCK